MGEEKGFFEKAAKAVKDFKIGGIPGNTIDKFEVCGVPGLTIDKAIRNLNETGSMLVSAEKDDGKTSTGEAKDFSERVAEAVKDFEICGIPGNTIDKFEVCGIPGLTIDKAIRNLGETGSMLVSAKKDDEKK